MAQIFKMLGIPLKDFENMVQNKKVMAKDGSIPQEMLEEYQKYKASIKEASDFLIDEEKKDTSAVADMEKAIQFIRESERKSTEDAINALYAKLLAEKRFEDLEKATQDADFRNQLFQEYKDAL